MESLKLCESDYRFMCVIWDNEPLASGKLVELCASGLGWKKSTTYTTLKKLCEKGFAKNENTVVTAVVKKEKVVKVRILVFAKDAKAEEAKALQEQKEAEELKKLIDEHK